MAVAKESINPEIALPSFAITRKISPGCPSSYIPTVMYPSCPPMLNLCVMALRTVGSLRRTGLNPVVSTALEPGSFAFSPCDAFSGWVRLELSR